MSTRAFTRLIGSSLIVTSSMVACSGAQMNERPALASNQASSIALNIDKALAGRDFARALLDAERLVEAQPREAAYRTLLGRAYLANGRYQSARAAFEDALALGATDPRTLVSLALVRTGLGDASGAHQLLADHISDLPAADYGLAITMAGDPNEGVRALLEAARQPGADAKVRQNLAYALALGGDWTQARLVAGEDLAGNALQQRIETWAATAQPDAAPQRVAALIGVAPRGDDSGQPARLALANSPAPVLAEAAAKGAADVVQSAIAEVRSNTASPAREAEATRAPSPAPMPAAPTPAPAPAPAKEPTSVAAAPETQVIAEAHPEPETQEAAIAFAPPAAPAPLIRASADPMREAVMRRIARTGNLAKPGTSNRLAEQGFAAIPPAHAANGVPHGGSDWVVQVGAYNSSSIAAASWTRAHGKALEARGYRRVTGTIALNGHTFYRLAMSGFSDRTAAAALCATLRSQGQSCFVRRDEGVAEQIRMAKAGKSVKTATLVKGKPPVPAAKPRNVAAAMKGQKVASR